jgi:glycosyltransferase involved in cell wall biosynthesis
MPAGEQPLVSIIVPTYNEEADIRTTMDALAALDYRLLEILVIDDASQDRTLEIVESYRDRIPSLHVLPQQTNRGVAASRNVGLKEAAGSIVVILNADVFPEPDFVRRIVPYYVRDEADYLIVDARVANGEAVYPRYVQARHEYELATMDMDTLHWTEGFSCKRDAALAVGGFPEEFPGASGEDAVFTERLVEAGYRRGMDFTIVVPHIAPPDLREFWKQRRGRGRGGAYRLYAYERQPVRWGSVIRSLGGTWLLAGLLVPAMVYAWHLTAYSPRGKQDWLPFAWAHSVDRVAVSAGYYRGCREITGETG